VTIEATLYSDAGCPWAYSANPAFRVLEWRFRDQLSWRLVMIGLREEPSEYAVRTYDGAGALARWHVFGERYGMPFAVEPKSRSSGTGRGCRAVIASALETPGAEWSALRKLQFGYFAGATYLDDPESLEATLGPVAARVDDPDVVVEYQRQRAEARAAEGSAAHVQDKTAVSDGLVRFTAPSVVFRRDGEMAVAGGWQPLLAYDTLLANFAPGLARIPAPESPEPLLEFFPEGLATAEVALLLAQGSDPVPDRVAAGDVLAQLAEEGRAVRSPLGTDAIWTPA
jgi:protein-disulfide isomerase-like protein with CxxC motif